jgi:hypothetical protein
MRLREGWCEPASSTRSTAGWAADHAKERTDRERDACLKPGPQLLPGPVIHPNLSAATTLAAAHGDRAAADLEIALGESQCFRDPEPSTPQHNN